MTSDSDLEEIEAILTFVPEAEYLTYEEAYAEALVRSDLAGLELEEDVVQLV